MRVCWSVKGGSGTTVFACALAVAIAERHGPTTVIDMCGDVPAVLGIAEPPGRGVRDWLTGSDRDPSQLDELAVAASTNLRMIPAGAPGAFDDAALEDLLHASRGRHVVVDFGMMRPGETLRQRAIADYLVSRPCYLSLRRAARLTQRPRSVVLMKEQGRSLTKRDVQAVIGAPVVAEIGVTEGIARCVDAGLLATRLPKSLAADLAALV